ncbi:hypothetical protein J7T55_002186 [Diaporthe amygdali]|uniref:uncharacterized protein n=1 Tax=Phomopsis amygdali TaxID=1214568 RepID=UPI0022FF264D|nr:uncharacterized protein J7T55_002186 [Diaporthe amygdali]KAJ0103854.1 hypothetical protein J7T55_002186 [Diaporthe amygdali]
MAVITRGVSRGTFSKNVWGDINTIRIDVNKIDDCANSMNRVDKNSNDESSLNVHLGGIFFGKTAQCPPSDSGQ